MNKIYISIIFCVLILILEELKIEDSKSNSMNISIIPKLWIIIPVYAGDDKDDD